MNGRRAVVGLCMLCALLVSAFAAQSASAATKGTTAFTCKNTGAVGFGGAHCRGSDAGGTGYSHIPVAESTTTEITISGKDTTEAGTTQKLKATVGGVAFELQTTALHGTGGMTNKKEPSGEHYFHGHEIVLTYTGVKVASPPEKGCKVFTDGAPGEEGVIHTNKLTATSAGQGDSLKLTPEVGNVFAAFEVKGCAGSAALEALNKTYSVTGSITCKPDGATLTCNHAETTEKNTLKLNESIKAGYEGTSTVVGGETPADKTLTPLSVTTVETA